MLSLWWAVGLTHTTAVGLLSNFTVLGLYLGWRWVSELFPKVFPVVFDRSFGCSFPVTAHCNSWSVKLFREGLLVLILHAHIEYETIWTSHIKNIPYHHIRTVVEPHWLLVRWCTFDLLFAFYLYMFEWCSYFGASAESCIGKVKNGG